VLAGGAAIAIRLAMQHLSSHAFFSVTALALLASALGCSPAASSAGQDPPTDAGIGALSCVTGHESERLATMLADPIAPGRGGGITLRPIDAAAKQGLRLKEVTDANCLGVKSHDFTTAGELSMAWGPHREVYAVFEESSFYVRRIVLDNGEGGAGYTGALTFHSDDNAHTYVIALGRPVTRDGAPVSLALDPKDPEVIAIYRGLTATFAPDTAPATTCEYPACGVTELPTDEATLNVANLGIRLIASRDTPNVFTRVVLETK
jgi:hypothetical protein